MHTATFSLFSLIDTALTEGNSPPSRFGQRRKRVSLTFEATTVDPKEIQPSQQHACRGQTMHINAYEAQPLTTTGCWVGAEQVVMTLLLPAQAQEQRQ